MRYSAQIIVVVILTSASLGQAPAGGARAADGGTTQPIVPRKIVPWLELAPNREAYDQAIEGLRLWHLTTDTAVISVGPGKAQWLRRLREQVPEVVIIPSLKTSPILTPPGFDSVQGWREVAREVRELCQATGQTMLVFEHETAIQSYMEGKTTLDWDRLRMGLRQLPEGITFWWYPSANGEGEILDRYIKLCEVADEVLELRFIDHATTYAAMTMAQPGTINAVRRLEHVAQQPPVQLIYCCGPGYWPYDRVPEALGKMRKDVVILYPGATRWVEAARAMSRLLPPELTTRPAGR